MAGKAPLDVKIPAKLANDFIAAVNVLDERSTAPVLIGKTGVRGAMISEADYTTLSQVRDLIDAARP